MVGEIAADLLDLHIVDAAGFEDGCGDVGTGQAPSDGHLAPLRCGGLHPCLRPQTEREAQAHDEKVERIEEHGSSSVVEGNLSTFNNNGEGQPFRATTSAMALSICSR